MKPCHVLVSLAELVNTPVKAHLFAAVFSQLGVFTAYCLCLVQIGFRNCMWLSQTRQWEGLGMSLSLVPRPSHIYRLQYEIQKFASERIISYCKRRTCKGLGTRLNESSNVNKWIVHINIKV